MAFFMDYNVCNYATSCIYLLLKLCFQNNTISEGEDQLPIGTGNLIMSWVKRKLSREGELSVLVSTLKQSKHDT